MDNEISNDTPSPTTCKLSMTAGRLHLRLNEREESIPTSIVYLRPLSGRSEIAFLDDESHEILYLESLGELAPACRELAERQLAQRYHMPQITSVASIDTIFGTHYWKVETDKGPCEFAFKEPGKNVAYLNEDRFVLRDAIGNRYEIRSLRELEPHSRRQVNKIL